MSRIIMHIDFNSFFASVEQQANPHLRGKPIGVTGGDRMVRTVLSTASKEAKKRGVRTGMRISEAKEICPELIVVPGDSEKYLTVTKKFLAILKDYSPYVEVFSIDEAFIELPRICHPELVSGSNFRFRNEFGMTNWAEVIAQEIKARLSKSVGPYITCSVGISYNKFLAKLASSLQKPDGLVVIPNQESAIKILDKTELDEVCGIGRRIKKRLNSMGVYNFQGLRRIPKENLLASFKSYGEVLYNMARGIDYTSIVPFYDKEEVKSVGHRHTIAHDTDEEVEIKQILLKITELIARRLRAKKLVGKTVVCYFRYALGSSTHLPGEVGMLPSSHLGGVASEGWYFEGDGMQTTISFTADGLEIFEAAWRVFHQIWDGQKIRMIGATVSNLKPLTPENLSLLPEKVTQKKIIKAIDQVNNRFGEFVLQRGILLGSTRVYRKPNPYLSDRRFKL